MKVLFHANNIIQFLQSLIFSFEFLICSRLWNKSLNIFGFFKVKGGIVYTYLQMEPNMYIYSRCDDI